MYLNAETAVTVVCSKVFLRIGTIPNSPRTHFLLYNFIQLLKPSIKKNDFCQL